MKKTIFLSIVAAILIIPQLTFAAWWNPFTWSIFHKSDTKAEVLEDRISELEAKLKDATSQDVKSSDKIVVESTEKKDLPIGNESNKKEIVTPKIVAVPNNIVPKQTSLTVAPEPPVDSTARCNFLSRKDVEGENKEIVKAEIVALTEGVSKYEVAWDNKYLTRIIDRNESLFTVSGVGNTVIAATLTRKSDGYKFRVNCPTITIFCSNFDCLSEDGKKISILQDIVDEIDTWYEGQSSVSTPTQRCSIGESIIRAYEYDYSLRGGKNIPGFSKALDCANNLAPMAYKAKIQVLMETLK